jgi:hypothetical protein
MLCYPAVVVANPFRHVKESGLSSSGLPEFWAAGWTWITRFYCNPNHSGVFIGELWGMRPLYIYYARSSAQFPFQVVFRAFGLKNYIRREVLRIY